MGFSAATKNLYGLIAGKGKVLRHFLVNNDIELFALVILRIWERVRPELTIVDAISTMEGRGPRRGIPVHRGLLIGSRNCLAIERVLTELIGCDISKHALVDVAKKYGFQAADLANIELINPDNKDLENFQLSSETLPISFSLPRIIKSCIRHLVILFSEKSRGKEPYL